MKMERWLSGRKHHTANVARGKPLHGFESHPLRKQRRECEAFEDIALRERMGFER